MVDTMKTDDDAPLTRYLIKHLRPLTEADPTLLANYVAALLKNNKPRNDLQKLCIEQLFDFLGEGTKTFVLQLFNALGNGTISGFHEDYDPKKSEDAATLATTVAATIMSSGDNTVSLHSTRVTSTNIGGQIDMDEEGSDDDDDDRNHKHRRRINRSRSLDRDTQDDTERGPFRKRNRPAENCQSSRENNQPSLNLPRLLQMDRDGLGRREGQLSRDHCNSTAVRFSMEERLHGGSRPSWGEDPASRFEPPNVLSRGILGRGRGSALGFWGSHEQRCAPFDGSDFHPAMLPRTPLYSSRSIPNRGNPPLLPWGGYGHHLGMANGALDPTIPINPGMQGPRGVAMGLGVNIGIGLALGRRRCPDFEERGYCLRGDLCPMEHGANRIVVEDVQSLSQFNLPVVPPSGCNITVGSAPNSGPSSVLFSSLLGFPGRTARETSILTLDGPSLFKGALAATTGSEPDFYDPDQLLWNREQSDVAEGMGRLPSFRKGQEESYWEVGASECVRGHTSDDGNPETYSPQGLSLGQSVWNRIGPVHGGESMAAEITISEKGFVDVPLRLKAQRKEMLDDFKTQGGMGKWEGEVDGGEENPTRISTLHIRKENNSEHAERGLGAGDRTAYRSCAGGVRTMVSGTERAQRTLYVSYIPNNNNTKDLLLAHFQKFGDVMDIRIPAHSDKAFVQFTRCEDAETALMSPDAVMGNRFIRLAWAKRDSVQAASDEDILSLPSNGHGVGSVSRLQNSLARGKEKAASEFTGTEIAGKFSNSHGQRSSSVALAQRKQEKLESLKEEIRRKQEELAQKRDDFRRKLDRLSKQCTGMKVGSGVDEPSSKRAKLEESEGASNVSYEQNFEEFFDLQPTDEKSIVSGGFSQTSSGSIFEASCRGPFPRPSVVGAGSSGSPQWGPSRYKLDNRTTVFRILPPVPDNVMDIIALREHFSNFGELMNLEVEDADVASEGKMMGKHAVQITFGSRHAAEQAFFHGRWFQGALLQFGWVNPPTNSLGVLLAGSKQENGANSLDHHPMVSRSGPVDKRSEDRTCMKIDPRSQDWSVSEITSGEEGIKSAGKVADDCFQAGQYHVFSICHGSDI